jgi:hypothetical protein
VSRRWRRARRLANEAAECRRAANALMAALDLSSRGALARPRSTILMLQTKLALLRERLTDRLFQAATRPLKRYATAELAKVDGELRAMETKPT